MLKKLLFIIIFANVGCRFAGPSIEAYQIEIASDSLVIIDEKEFKMTVGCDMDVLADNLMHSIAACFAFNSAEKIAYLKVDDRVKYGVLWTVVHALEKTGFEVNIIHGALTVRLLARNSCYGLDYYLLDDVEIRSFACLDTPVIYGNSGKFDDAVGKILIPCHDEHSLLEIRCYTFMPVEKLLTFFDVVRHKGYDGVNLAWPLPVRVADAVTSFLSGDDGL